MTESERLLMTLGFEKRTERGSVLETFFPWDKTVKLRKAGDCLKKFGGQPAVSAGRKLHGEISER